MSSNSLLEVRMLSAMCRLIGIPLGMVLFFCPILRGEEKSVDQMAVEAISHPEGLELSLWATSEQVANPVAFTFDNQGRMYMCETFRQNKGVEDNRSHMDWLDDDLAAQSVEERLAYFKKHLKDDVDQYSEEEDRITVIADEDGDGKADNDWVFADGFNDILTGTGAGVLVNGDDVYYTCIPELWKISDKDRDGTSDSRESLHHGYGVRVAFRGHDSHGLVLGPDGRIYYSIGDRGYNIRTDDGRELKDAESGAVFRCELDGSGLEVFATGLRNPQELAFDDAGNLFTGDNNSDSGDKARWVHVVEGGETGWRMAFQYLSDRGPWNREKLWHPRHEGQAAYIVPPIRNFADGPSGLTYYPGTGLSDEYRGTFFLCDFRGDAAISGVRSFKMQPKGASFEMSEPRRFLWNVLATDIEFGPDGGLYTSDWIEGWEGVNRGRIVRVSDPTRIGSNKVQKMSEFLKQDISEMKAWKVGRHLGHDDRRVRMKAQMELVRRDAASVLAKLTTNEKMNTFAKMHAVWALGHIGRTTEKTRKRERVVAALQPLVQHEHAWVRAATVTAMGDMGDRQFHDALLATLNDEDLNVRARAATAIGKLRSPKSIEPLVKLIAENDNVDAVLRHGSVMGLSGSANEDQLVAFSSHEKQAVRLAAVLSLRRLKSKKLTEFLNDADPFIILEAARAIHDVPVSGAMSELATLISNFHGNTSQDEALVRRVLNANYRIGGAEQARDVASVIASPGMTDDMKLEAIAMLGDWNEPSSRDRVLGMWRPIASRSGDAAKMAFQEMLSNDVFAKASPEVTVAAIEVASKMGLSQIASTIREMVADPRVEPAQRAKLLTSLSQLKDEKLGEAIKRSLKDESPIVRSRARDLLFDMDESRGLAELSSGVVASTATERQAALAKLASIGGDRAKEIVKGQAMRLAKNEVPADTRLDVLTAAEKLGLADHVASYSKSLEDKPFGKWRLALAGGDVAHGEEIFKTNITLSCLRCHSVAEEGGSVGPNLAGIGKEKTPEYLLESIIDPNKKIAEGFGTLIVVTEEGEQLQGLVRKEADDLIHMIDADGKRFHVVKDEIIARKNGISAMPADLVEKLTPFQLRDLVAYLQSLKTPYVEVVTHEE